MPIYDLRFTIYDLDVSALARGDAERERRWKEGAWGGSGRKGAGAVFPRLFTIYKAHEGSEWDWTKCVSILPAGC